MLRLTWFEFIVRGIPEEFIFVLAIHAFSKTAINLKKYLLSGILASIMIYLIRSLPIQYGVHTLLGLMMLTILVNCINKIDAIKAIRAAIITFILCFILEGINVVFLQLLLKKNLNSIMGDNILRTLTGLPSLIALGIIVVTYYYILSRRKELQYV